MVTLRFENWTATVVPECGSNVVSLCCDEKEILRRADSLEQLRSRPCLYGIPLLLPANRLAGGKFRFEDQTYSLPVNELALGNHIHGLLKDAPFQVLEQCENVVLTCIENQGEYYPFPFRIEIEDSLDKTGYCRRLTVFNTGKKNMPFTLAYHITFAEPTEFAVPLLKACEIDRTNIPTGKTTELNPLQEKYRDGMRPDGSKINGLYTSGGRKARIGDLAMSISDQFDHWVLFNGAGNEGYLCVEPQCGNVNGLNNGEHLVLKPGARESFVLRIEKW